MDRRGDKRTDRRTNVWVGKLAKDRWMSRRTDGRKYGLTDERIDRLKDRQTDGRTNQWMDVEILS